MDRIPLAYTFGNHMHWVDMEWLWGYHVLPGSVRDMIHLCREAGVKGCVNFDGVGYEKLASENPEAFAELRDAVRSGMIEIVGASYGQPYGLFHGGESNIRQRIYGVRAAMRLFGVRPRTFWEEEFDFFPQLPQMLAGCGFTGASLYFQWTWHTPEIPREEVPVILWEGLDGTQLPTATRNRLNLHQWPEDMDILLKELAEGIESAKKTAKALHRASNEGMIDRDDLEDAAITLAEGPKPLILQWLELMPSPDWMCRSELILPKLRELLDDPRFAIEHVTLGEYLAANAAGAPVRRYGMDDVWHGMTLGKNGDRMRLESRTAEASLVRIEALAATLSLFGRPYRQWDVYPTWELEEAWRYLLMAQHHDNDECEGLCGHVGLAQYQMAQRMAHNVRSAQEGLTKRQGQERVVWNSHLSENGPFGWVQKDDQPVSELAIVSEGKLSAQERRSPIFEGTMDDARAALQEICPGVDVEWLNRQDGSRLSIGVMNEIEGLQAVALSFTLLYDKPKPGLNDSIQLQIKLDREFKIRTDQAYSIIEVNPTKSWPKKYPSGDWMTSPQWFETVERPFTSYRFVDLVNEDGSGVLILHCICQQWFKDDDGVRCVLSAYDPWDEDFYQPPMQHVTFIPHGPLTDAERWRIGNHRSHAGVAMAANLPLPSFSPVHVGASNVVATAFYRETEEFSGRGLDTYAGTGMGYPFVLRLVEMDGIDGDILVTVPGPVAAAFKTNLLGEIEAKLVSEPGEASSLGSTLEELGAFGIVAETLRLPMRGHEIATLYMDLMPGRKVARDLDAKREVWATVHRTSS